MAQCRREHVIVSVGEIVVFLAKRSWEDFQQVSLKSIFKRGEILAKECFRVRERRERERDFNSCLTSVNVKLSTKA